MVVGRVVGNVILAVLAGGLGLAFLALFGRRLEDFAAGGPLLRRHHRGERLAHQLLVGLLFLRRLFVFFSKSVAMNHIEYVLIGYEIIF